MAIAATTYSIQATRANLTEGNSGVTVFTFTVTRSSGTGTGSVAYRLQDLTTNASDFSGATSGVVQFAAGQTSKTFSISVVGDLVVETDEQFRMLLENPVNGTVLVGEAIGIIRNNDLPTLSIAATSATKAEGSGGTTPFTFTVTRSSGVGTSAVNWVVRNGGTTAADFSGATSGTVSFAAGETSKVITVQVASDLAVESNEAFSVVLSGPSGAKLGTTTASGLIQNDDALPTLSIAATSATKAEGNSGTTPFTFTVTRSNGVGTSSARWAVQHVGTAAADFSGATSGTVSFAAGETSKVITLNVIGNTTIEGDEAFSVLLSSASGATIGTASASGVIQNDDALPTLSIAATSVTKAEGNSGTTPFTFTVTRSSGVGASSASWAVQHVGTAVADFSGATSGTVSFAAGETSKVITLNVVGDLAVESDETFTVLLSGATGATIATALAGGVIQNDDVPPTPTLSIAATSATKAEGNSGTTTPFTFTVTRSNSVGVSAVDYAVVNGGTTAADFTGTSSGTVSFADGQTSQVITINVTGDAAVESDEAFTVQLSNAVNATIGTASAGGTIQNDDAAPATLSIAATSATKAEGNSGTTPFTFTVTRSNGVGASTVDYAIVNGGTTAGDFGAPTSGTVSFLDGETSKVITVNVTGDMAVEGDEAFTVTLSNAVNATIGTASAGGTIQNDDAAPATLSIAATSATKAEGNSGTTPFTFTVTRSNSTGASAVDYAIVNGGTTAADFGAPTSGTVSFLNGETSKVITVNVTGDTAVESDEAFTVQLSNAVNATIATATASGTIQNDDATVVATLSIAATSASKAEGNSGTTPFTFTVTRSNSVGASTANWALQHSGTAAADFSGTTSGIVSFADGETSKVITLNAVGDTVSENDEAFSVLLSGATNATIATASAAGTLLDDDTAVISIAATGANKAEGNSYTSPPTVFTFTVSRTLATGSSTVNYSVSPGTATVSSDYYGTTSGSVSFAVGETTKTISVNVVGDSNVEGDETFTVTLTGVSGGRLGTTVATATIINDDLPGIDGSSAQVTGFTIPAAVDDSIDNIVDDSKWGGAIGSGVALTYSFSTASSVFSDPDPGEVAPSAFNTAQQSAATSAMAALAAVSGVSFSQTTDTATSAGDIRWTRSTDPALGSVSYAYLPSSLGAGGDIWIGPSTVYDNPTSGNGAYAVFLHELGHALGLTHPHEGTPVAEPGEDQTKYTIMSYRPYDGSPLYGAAGAYLPTSYMLNDVLALQYLYGVNTTTNLGDTVYQWSATSKVYECLWDVGGNDTIDASNQTVACTINLNGGAWSSIGQKFDIDPSSTSRLVNDTLTIAYEVTGVAGVSNLIENAIGSAQVDVLIGNAAANVLTGGAGADTLTGNAGADAFRFVTTAHGGDTITDFLSGTDVIEVSSVNFGGLAVGSLGASRFVSGNAPVAADGSATFLYNTGNGQLIFDANGSAANGTTLIATLSNLASVSASDIRIVAAMA